MIRLIARLLLIFPMVSTGSLLNTRLLLHQVGHAILSSAVTEAPVVVTRLTLNNESCDLQCVRLRPARMRDSLHAHLLVRLGGAAAEEVLCGREQMSKEGHHDRDRGLALASRFGKGDESYQLAYSEAISLVNERAHDILEMAATLLRHEEIVFISSHSRHQTSFEISEDVV